jgi:hypothetical protein
MGLVLDSGLCGLLGSAFPRCCRFRRIVGAPGRDDGRIGLHGGDPVGRMQGVGNRHPAFSEAGRAARRKASVLGPLETLASGDAQGLLDHLGCHRLAGEAVGSEEQAETPQMQLDL